MWGFDVDGCGCCGRAAGLLVHNIYIKKIFHEISSIKGPIRLRIFGDRFGFLRRMGALKR
jgi:hypothetical protein